MFLWMVNVACLYGNVFIIVVSVLFDECYGSVDISSLKDFDIGVKNNGLFACLGSLDDKCCFFGGDWDLLT